MKNYYSQVEYTVNALIKKVACRHLTCTKNDLKFIPISDQCIYLFIQPNKNSNERVETTNIVG
jgi:hypothetical protein